MKKLIITLFCIACSVLTLTACSKSPWLYRVSVQQGNVLTSDVVHQLHKGMSKEAVCEILGPPLLQNTFNNNRWTYVYTLKTCRGPYVSQALTLYFRNNILFAMSSRNLPS